MILVPTNSLASLMRPRLRAAAIGYDVFLVLGGSLLIALSARVSIPLGFSPVPITGQTFGVFLIGALYGPVRGAATVIAYLVEGACGLPVFAGGASGAAALWGPTGGYLVGFVPAAAIVGCLAERGWDRRFLTTLAAMFMGNCVLYACGLVWLAGFVGIASVLGEGLVPFLPGAVVKAVLAAAVLPGGWWVLAKLGAATGESGARG